MAGPRPFSPAISEDDEFMTYYKKYRPEYGTSSPVYTSSQNFHPLTDGGGDSTATNYDTWQDIPPSLSRSSSAVRRGPWYQNLKKKFKLKSKSMEERTTTPRRPQPLPITRQAKFQICSYSSSSSASPLGGLSSMLSDTQSQGDETQSRDSGHSSGGGCGGGGSPDLRGLRLRGRASAEAAGDWLQDAHAPLPYRGYQARSTDNNWYFRRARSRSPSGQRVSTDRDTTVHRDIESDTKSICSYETATDYGSLRMPPPPPPPPTSTNATQTSGGGLFQEGVDCESSDAFLRRNNSGCKCQRGTRSPSLNLDLDSRPETGVVMRLDYWCPGSDTAARQRMPSPHHIKIGASTCKGADTDKRLRRSGNGLPVTMTKGCLRFWHLLKIVLALTSSCFLLLAFLFSYRSWHCENEKRRSWDLDRLSADLIANVYGQDGSMAEIVDAIRGFLLPVPSRSSAVSVLVLAGWLGGGKTFVSSIIRSAFPVAENVHVFSVPLHFSSEASVGHLDDLSLHIRRSCGHSLVVFDDADGAMSVSATDAIERFVLSLLQPNTSRGEADPAGATRRRRRPSNGTLVLILTNAGGAALNEHTLAAVTERGVDGRDALFVEGAVEVLLAAAETQPPFRIVAAAAAAAAAAAERVSVRVVPFLPLTRVHVKQCVSKEIMRQELRASEDQVEMIVSELEFYATRESDQVALSKNGCKQVASKVDYHLGGQFPYLGEL